MDNSTAATRTSTEGTSRSLVAQRAAGVRRRLDLQVEEDMGNFNAKRVRNMQVADNSSTATGTSTSTGATTSTVQRGFYLVQYVVVFYTVKPKEGKPQRVVRAIPYHWIDRETLWYPPSNKSESDNQKVNRETWRRYKIETVFYDTKTTDKRKAELDAAAILKTEKMTRYAITDSDVPEADKKEPVGKKASEINPPSAPKCRRSPRKQVTPTKARDAAPEEIDDSSFAKTSGPTAGTSGCSSNTQPKPSTRGNTEDLILKIDQIYDLCVQLVQRMSNLEQALQSVNTLLGLDSSTTSVPSVLGTSLPMSTSTSLSVAAEMLTERERKLLDKTPMVSTDEEWDEFSDVVSSSGRHGAFFDRLVKTVSDRLINKADCNKTAMGALRVIFAEPFLAERVTMAGYKKSEYTAGVRDYGTPDCPFIKLGRSTVYLAIAEIIKVAYDSQATDQQIQKAIREGVNTIRLHDREVRLRRK